MNKLAFMRNFLFNVLSLTPFRKRFQFIGNSSKEEFSEVIDLELFEKKVFSQNGEDGILIKIFSVIGSINNFYVEFGVESGAECNTCYLRKKAEWQGLMMDSAYENPELNLQRECITAENINKLFQKYNVPFEFDLLSIDIDYNDFYVWKALSEKYRPRVVVIEYNATHLPHEDKVVKYDTLGSWDGTNYYGASILSLYKLGRKKGYSLVYAENRGVNLFFIRDDILENVPFSFKEINNVTKIFKYPSYGSGPNGGHVADSLNRTFLTSDELLRRY